MLGGEFDLSWGQVAWWAAFAAVAVAGSARLTRLVVHDSFPPAVWVRMRWDRVTRDGSWSTLAHCHWCLGPWLLALALVTAWATDVSVWWWLFWGWLGASYATSWLVEHDEKDG